MNDDPMLFERMAARVLQRLPHAQHGRSVLITSARPGEGRSFVAAALAAAVSAQLDGGVALVECTPAAARQNVGVTSAFAWTDLVTAGGTELPKPASPGRTQLVRIPYGAADGPVLFRTAGVTRAITLLRDRFAFVVLDGPILADCGVLAACTDGSLLVVNAERTRREIVIGGLKANPIAARRMLGTVLNEIPRYVPQWLYRRAL